MIGMSVVTDEGEKLGSLSDVMQTGANDVYIVENNGNELLLPAIKECILDIDDENRRITVHMMPGLR